MNLALVGATGMVGRTMLKVLEERNIEPGQISFMLYPLQGPKASLLNFKGKEYSCITLEES